jgi:hypothetical protein
MGDPWFRPWSRFRYRPITWQGWAILALQVGLCGSCGLVVMCCTQSNFQLAMCAAVIGFVTYYAFNALMAWKTQSG